MNNSKHYDTTRLNELPFSQVVAHLGGDIRRKGSQNWTHCLWHDDHSPSLVINEKSGRNNCHCFVCDRSWSVIDYVMKHQGIDFLHACELLSNEFGIFGFDNKRSSVSMVKRRPPVTEKQREITYIPFKYVEKSLSHENSFSKCMYQLFDSYLVDYVSDEYLLGNYCGKDFKGGEISDGTIFWMIDEHKRVHNGKMQVYDTDVSSDNFFHYDHADGRVQYIGWQLKGREGVDRNAEFDNNCLFGAHLLGKYPNSTVVLVESPKNALLGACYQPQMVWVAAGSMSLLKPEVLAPLRNRKVIVMPDRDAIPKWKEEVKSMKWLANFYVSDFCERMAPEGRRTYDVADFVIDKRIEEMLL